MIKNDFRGDMRFYVQLPGTGFTSEIFFITTITIIIQLVKVFNIERY